MSCSSERRRRTNAANSLTVGCLLSACCAACSGADDSGTAADPNNGAAAGYYPGSGGGGAGSSMNPGGSSTSGGTAGTGGAVTAGAGGIVVVGGAGGVVGGAGSGGLPGGTGGVVGVPPSDIALTAIGANTTIGLEWPVVTGATGYRLYWSTSPGVTPATGQPIDVTAPDFVHRGLTNGTTYYYAVAPITPQGEGAPSAEASAVPAGEWALERLGTGRFDDVVTGASVAQIPIERRLHVFLFAEGYTSADLPVFHDEASHGSRGNDVDRWVDLVFGIEPYSLFSEAFVVWYLPRASNTQIGGGDTAFMVPVDTSASPIMQSVPATGETSLRAWTALGIAPFPPSVFYQSGQRRARNDVASFLIFDPNRGRASVSGLTTSLTNPGNSNQRIGTAFGVGHAHEFTHAFSQLRDEYIETSNNAPTQWSDTSNVVGTNVCSDLPWSHLLVGTAINPSTDNLVGAFGDAAVGYHSELLCLLNGTHDNATHYGGSGLLRVEDRMCNFCREITAFRIFERTSVLADEATSFDTWVSTYRTPFYTRYGFKVPAVVPQTNDPRNPSQGTPYFEACTP
jgi:hypothetical protein